jgi:mono/diheme cytochrome c family protein
MALIGRAQAAAAIALTPHQDPFRPDPAKDAVWNRGAYLVEGPGHCGACHTPRGTAFQESALDQSDDSFLSGAALDGWTAPSLRGDSAAGLGRWSQQDLVAFLKHGGNIHASVFGPMTDVYNNSSQYLSDDDLTAIATYLKSLPAATKADWTYAYDDATAKTLAGGDLSAAGAGAYGAHCASCHGIDGKGRGDLFPPLAGNPNVLTADPSSIINVVLNGSQPTVTQGVPDSYRMAPYRLLLNDQQIADLATFLRQSWGNKGTPVSAEQVAKLRSGTDMSSDRAIILQMR